MAISLTPCMHVVSMPKLSLFHSLQWRAMSTDSIFKTSPAGRGL